MKYLHSHLNVRNNFQFRKLSYRRYLVPKIISFRKKIITIFKRFYNGSIKGVMILKEKIEKPASAIQTRWRNTYNKTEITTPSLRKKFPENAKPLK